MEIGDYIFSYPDIETDYFYKEIIDKYEFHNKDDSDFFQYQENIGRFLSAKTLYQSLLIIHEMGTGKTGSAICLAFLIKEQDPNFKKIIVLANGKTQLNNFKQEIFNRIPKLFQKYTTTTDKNTILRKEGFYFDTYRMFSKTIQYYKNDRLKMLYENTIFIFDEIHNLTSSVSSKDPDKTLITNTRAYKILHNLVHILKNRKLLCMTGTPIRDKPEEIAKILNMVIPIENQFPIGEAFKTEYLNVVSKKEMMGDIILTKYEMKKDKISDFQKKVQGYVSYLKSTLSKDIDIEYQTNSNIEIPSIQHFKIYGHKMGQIQNEHYLQNLAKDLQGGGGEEENDDDDDNDDMKKSLAYSRSKQASLFTFPSDEESIGKNIVSKYVNVIYESSVKDIFKSGKKIKNFQWKKEMWKLFPSNISLQNKLKLVYEYSCIYSFVIQKIIENPSELVYIYSFLKTGCGVYLLVSFLLEYFNFELVRKKSDLDKKTGKRRILILNHDFFSDNELREIIDLFNSDENCFAQNIQIVIGTKQTKEGITLKNIRQIHIIQADWNYSDISQAIARGLRINSHKILFETMTKVIVKIYQHAAIPFTDENTLDTNLSIDVEQYVRSELKDENIKTIERQLIISAWDCQLNKSSNQGNKDYTRDCEYQLCDYQCRGIITSDNKMNYQNYDLLYSEIAKQNIRDILQNCFSQYFQISFDDLISGYFPKYENIALLYITINEMIEQNYILYNSFNIPNYLRRWNDLYFLVSDIFQRDIQSLYYNQYPVLTIGREFSELSKNFIYNRFSEIVKESMKKFYIEKNQVEALNKILYSLLDLQEIFIESLVIYLHSTKSLKNIEQQYSKFILQHYINQNRLELKDNNVYISTLMDHIRQFDPETNKWINVEKTKSKSISSEEENNPEFINKYITDNPYKYYGIIETSKDKTIFKIRDVHDTDLIFGSNKAKIPKGEVCGQSFSKKKIGLIEILLTLKFEMIEKSVTIDVIKKEKEKLLQDLLKLLKIKEFTDDQLYTIYFLSKLKIPELCGIAKKQFEKLDLLYYKNI